MTGTRVAVVVPCFNGGATVEEAVDSVLAQDEAVELVVVDDGSTDPATLAALDRLRARDVHVVRQENAGLGAARMAGVRATSAPLVLPLDCDDVLLPGAVGHLADLLDAHPDAVMAWGGYERFGHEHTHQPLPGALDAWQITYMNEHPATSLIRRDALEATGGFALRANYEDWDLFMTFAERGMQGVGSDRMTFRYRRVGTGMLHGAHDEHDQHYEHLRARHPELFAARRRNWWRSSAPLALRLTLPVVEVLPLARERKRLAGSILSHLAHRRGLRLLVRRIREVRATDELRAGERVLAPRPRRLQRLRERADRAARAWVRRPKHAIANRLLVLVAVPVALAQRLRGPGYGMALVYHRVAPAAGDPARELVPAVAADDFRAQVAHMQRHYALVPAGELPGAAARRRRGQRIPVAITFDDDDPSHLRHSAPILRQLGAPATFFLNGASLQTPRAFWWHRLQTAFDAGLQLPAPLPAGNVHDAARAVQEMAPAERLRLDQVLTQLVGVNGAGVGMPAEDVRALGADFEIGFHTIEHHPFDTLDDDELRRALAAGRPELEAAAGRRLDVVSYPHGRYDGRTAAAVEAAGFAVGYTGAACALRPGGDPRLIGRLDPGTSSLGVIALMLAVLPMRPDGGSDAAPVQPTLPTS